MESINSALAATSRADVTSRSNVYSTLKYRNN